MSEKISFPKIVLKKHEDDRIRAGHLWVFSNEIDTTKMGSKLDSLKAGDIVDIWSAQNIFLGRGFVNPQSLIAIRLLTYKNEVIDENFWISRLLSARQYRHQMDPLSTSYRYVFGESDGIPGLVIDRYDATFVLQSFCAGMDALIENIVSALKKVENPQTIILKNDNTLRSMENLSNEVRWLLGEEKQEQIIELKTPDNFLQQTPSKVRFAINFKEGQKSGFFFDQKENREKCAYFSRGKSVLDAYSYSGAFGLYAAFAGARSVCCIDSSKLACDLIHRNSELNGLQSKISVDHQDVFERLKQYQQDQKRFDVIVVDPPAFAKNKKNIFGAIRKYQQLNELAISLLEPGGLLVSCSCSHHLNRDEFMKMLGRSAFAQKRQIRVIEFRGAAFDHPVHPSMSETEYLKCVFARVN